MFVHIQSGVLCRTVLKLLKEISPYEVGFVFDSRTNWRKKEYSLYKYSSLHFGALFLVLFLLREHFHLFSDPIASLRKTL